MEPQLWCGAGICRKQWHKVSDALTTRLGYRTEYNSDPLPGLKRTDNKLTAALVIGF
ncbi:DUF481 domain-containing protein [Halovulum sp. GXIMD14793]